MLMSHSHGPRAVPQSANRSHLAGAGFLPMLIVGLLLLVRTELWAQGTTADVLGTVTDASGAVLTGVGITVHNLDTGADYTSLTDKSGQYVVTSLAVARYSIK